jgi:hypothetical protein
MAICRNIQNNVAYEYLGENKFKNLLTLKEGVVDDETAAKIFKINIDATQIILDNPLVAEFINKLQLKFDNNKK